MPYSSTLTGVGMACDNGVTGMNWINGVTSTNTMHVGFYITPFLPYSMLPKWSYQYEHNARGVLYYTILTLQYAA